MTLAAFFAALALHLVVAASPGPAILMTARTGVTEGFGTGVWLSFGIGLGAVVWALAALFGLAVLFEIAPTLLWGFKLAGGLFLCWMAFQMWRHAAEPLQAADHGRPPRSRWSAFRLGLFTQLANPKPAVFFGAVFLGTVPFGTSFGWMVALLIGIWINEVACNLVVARAFSFSGPRRAYAQAKAGIDRVFGGVLALIGLKIAAT